MAGWLGKQLHRGARWQAGQRAGAGADLQAENIPDLRNSKVADLVSTLGRLGHAVTVHDPQADPDEALHEYGIPLVGDALARRYDMVVLAVPHREYLDMGAKALRQLVSHGGTLADLKGELGAAADWSL